ncbi:MAG TPA: GDSL-type esterase/lipase family protein [Acidobacteriaceae bacterium]|nr:GDSL-type esterase/lipase family protein [Acidobacteriaceae bacterium]
MHPCSSRLRFFLAAVLAVAMVGCKQKPAPEPAATPSAPTPSAAVSPQPAPPAKDDRPVIVAFGDSLTAGYGTDAGNSYPDFLEQDLNAQGFHYHVINAGVSGNTTKDGVERLDDVVSLKPVLVIVAFGGNDGLRGLPIDSTRKNLDQMVSTLQRAGIKVVLGGITLPPNYGADYIRQFNQSYALLARQYHVPLLPFLLQDVYGTAGSMQPDGIHATAQGNQQVARNLLPLVTPLLHKN